jgi:hypothetical protein
MLAWPLSALIPAPVLAAGFDVSVTVESAAADPTPELAFTGASLWVLIALVAVLLAAGSVMLEESRRRSGSTT